MVSFLVIYAIKFCTPHIHQKLERFYKSWVFPSHRKSHYWHLLDFLLKTRLLCKKQQIHKKKCLLQPAQNGGN